MISITQDPQNPDRLILTQTVTLFLDRVLLETLNDEIEKAIREQAAADLKSVAARREIKRRTTAKMLELLAPAPEEKK